MSGATTLIERSIDLAAHPVLLFNRFSGIRGRVFMGREAINGKGALRLAIPPDL
jgi:hypothetical protein